MHPHLRISPLLVALSFTLAATESGSAQPPADLSADDVQLLKLASNWHYVNGKFFGGELSDYTRHHALIARQAALPGEPGDLGRLVLIRGHVYTLIAKNADAQRRFHAEFPLKLREAAFDGALLALKGEKMPSFAEYRQGLGRPQQDWLDRYRDSETGGTVLRILGGLATERTADVFESYYAPKLGGDALAPADWRMKGLLGNQYGKGFGHFLELTYQGSAPLTNVVFVGRLKRTGPSSTLTATQLNVLAANEVSGAGDKVPAIREMFEEQNVLGSMSLGGLVHVPAVRPGDRVQITIGGAPGPDVLGSTVAIYADQGRLRGQEIEYPKTGERPAPVPGKGQPVPPFRR